MEVVSIGVDVAKASVVAAYWDGERSQPLGSFSNGRAADAALLTAVQATATRLGAATVRLVLEPTGGYEAPLALAAHQLGWTVWLPNPLQVKRFGQGRGQRGKTDAADAGLLACYGALGQGTAWQPLPAAVQTLQLLLERLAQLEQLARQEQNRAAALALLASVPPAVLTSLATLATAVAQAQADLAAAIQAHLTAEPALAAQAERLATVPGVGSKTVLPLLVLLGRWETHTAGQGTSRQLTAYVGLDPQPFQSGSSVYRAPHISRHGDADLRRRLFCAAAGGIRSHSSVLGQFAARLRARGKPWKVIVVAAARRLLRWAWAVYHAQQPFDPARAAAQLPAAA